MFYQFNHLGSPDYLKIEKGENFSFAAHLHRCFELIIILSGEMHITVDNKSFNLKEKQALLIFPNQIHSMSSDKSKHILCIFSPDLIKAYSNKTNGMVPKNNIFCPDEYLINTLNEIKIDSNLCEKKGLLYSFCGQFDKTASYEPKQKYHDKLLYKLFAFVEDNFNSQCTLEEISAKTGYNYSYISRFFKETVGISFNSYVNHYRLSHACYLLDNSDSPIISCALESGFDSIRTFNRNFKLQYGITPGQYRNANR